MNLERALAICEQVSPMPQLAHEAMVVLRDELQETQAAMERSLVMLGTIGLALGVDPDSAGNVYEETLQAIDALKAKAVPAAAP